MRRARPWLAVLAVAIVAAGAWSLQRSPTVAGGPLAPLGWLVGGEWRGADSDEAHETRRFEWSSGGLTLREERGRDGAAAGERTYHWHHGEDEIAVHGVQLEGHLEGLVRVQDDGSIELQYKLWNTSGEALLYRERSVRTEPNRLSWKRWRLIDSEETLDREAILVRNRR